MALTIGQIAKLTGVAAKTIRFYEGVGVLSVPSRTAAGYRQYREAEVQQLLFVRRARALGLSLRHLKALASALNGGPRGLVRPRVLEVVRAHLSTVKRQIAELELLQRQLEQVLRRIQAPSRVPAVGRCRCLDLEDDHAAAPSRSGTATRAAVRAVAAEGSGPAGRAAHRR